MLRPAARVCFLLAIPVLLLACGEQQEQAAPEVVRPVKTMAIPEPESGGIRTFPARIESQRRAQVSFRVPGKITELPIKEGDVVKQGQVIAKLDPTDYRLVVEEREATLFRAQRDFERAKPLAEKGFVTKRELDRREANMKTARASLQQAQQDLSYTTLKAPFDGGIAKRLVQKFEEVEAKQPILELRDLDALEVKFDVPEQIMILVTQAAEGRGEVRADPDIYATFDAAPEKRFDLKFKEVATRADPATRTFEATYTLPTPKGLTVLPGMTANVTVDLTSYLGSSNVIYVPVESVTATNELSGKVWVVNEETMTLSAREVKVGPLRGEQISIREGLKPGERVVIAGVPFLFEGMKVSLMAAPEQAKEREDDAKIRWTAEQGIEGSPAKDQQAIQQ